MSRALIPWALGACLAVGLHSSGGLRAFDTSNWGFAMENGDANGDQGRDLSDGVYLLNFLFLGGSAPVPLADCFLEEAQVANGDINGDAAVDVTDGVNLLGWLFGGGADPVSACSPGISAGGDHCERILASPKSKAFGKTLAQWLEIYWRWYFGSNSDLAQSKVGKVQLLPIPAGNVVGGSFTPADPLILQGELSLTLPHGTPFVTPLYAWTRETYDPSLGIPDDNPIPDDVMNASVSPNLTIDGCKVITDANERRYYIPSTLIHPPIMYAEPSSYGSIGVIAFQGVGLVANPLSPGVHVMKLYEPYIVSGVPGIADFGIIYDNTWTITVLKGKEKERDD